MKYAILKFKYKNLYLTYINCVLLFYNYCDAQNYITVYSDNAATNNLIQVEEGTNALDSVDLHSRSKRSIDGSHQLVSSSNSQEGSKNLKKSKSGKEPLITKFELKNSHREAIVDWAGEGSQVVVCVTKDKDQNENSTASVFISYDYATNFHDKTKDFKVDNNKYGIIYSFFKNDKFTDRFVFTDVVNKYLFVTFDYGRTIIPRKLQFTPSEVSMHPTNSMIFLVLDRDDSKKRLWITSDFGETWNTLSFYVNSYFWSEKSSSPTLYVERDEPDSRSNVIAFSAFPEDGKFVHRTLISGVKNFHVNDEFLFAVKEEILYGAPTHDDTLQLFISFKGGPFLLAQFPNNLTHQDYHIADVSNGQILVCVFHGISSNLYVSSVPTSSASQIKFSLSLERILYFSPNTNWKNTWLNKKADFAFADLYRVKGVRGVFIASQLVATYEKSSSNLGPEHLTSLITFDQGGEWKPLNPPKIDNDGKTTNCLKKNNCSLHIRHTFGKLYPVTRSEPILSTKSAPGMILASGTLGLSLEGHPGLFLSTDAGDTWYQVLKGNYLYVFGDHGGIMVVVQHYRSSNLETNEIMYSIDEGETWYSHTFSDEKFRIYGLITEPGENTTIFTLFGSKMTMHEWIIIKVDMKPVFDHKCTNKDYKTWTPFDPIDGRFCLLGQMDTYERRVPRSNCFNGIDYDKPISTENCPCSVADYECDFGFESIVQSNGEPSCVEDTDDVVNPFLIPASCKETGYYNRTRGYRRIPGDTCVGGAQEKYVPERMPCPVKEEMAFLLVSNRKNIFRYNLMAPTEGLQALPLEGLEAAIALDFHMKNNCLYWSDVITKKIMRQCFDGEHQEEVVVDSDIESVEGMALDWVSNLLYFVDGRKKTIEIVKITTPLTDSMRKILFKQPQVDHPRGIALHVVRGYMFFTDWSENNPMVARAHLDGTNLKVLFDKGTVGWPNGITIDHQTERIFWGDAKKDYIASADLDGKNFRRIIEQKDNVRQPYSVGVYKSLLFWDDWSQNQLFEADKEHGLGVTSLISHEIKRLVDLKVYGRWTQTGSNACGGDSAKCQYFCVGKPNNDYACLCPSWLKSVNNGKHIKCVCEDDSDPLESGACIASKSTCAANFFRCDNNYCIPKTMVCDMDNDCGDNSDEKHCGKNSCGANSWQCKNGHCISPAWKCDTDNDCGDNSDEEDCVYAKCTDQQFTCTNKRCIDKNWVCDLQDDCRDGSDEANCTLPHPNRGACKSDFQFQCKSSGICLPISWRCDSEFDCSDKSDEEDCSSHKCRQFQFQCSSNKCIYQSWVCDGDKDCEDGSDEANCSSTSHKTTPFPHTTLRPIFPTWNRNHTCKAFEFQCTKGHCIPFWWRCDGALDCFDGSDEADCLDSPDESPQRETTPASPTTKKSDEFACREDQMECGNGDCIWESWVCDGSKDCPTGEDEENCEVESMCPSDHFRCWRSKGCIQIHLRCNGRPDCADGSDELGCHLSPFDSSNKDTTACSKGFFACDGGNCLPNTKKCDHNIDCIDLTDEKSCSGNESQAYQVSNLKIKDYTNTSLSFEWNFRYKSNGTSFEFLPSCIVKAALGNAKAWKNGTWTHDQVYTFNHLLPFTTYLLKVYVREKKSAKIFPSSELLTMTTGEGIPSPPVNVRVNQVIDLLLIRWEEPHHPNGRIVSFKVFVSPPVPAKTYFVEHGVYKFIFRPSQLRQNYTIWMTTSNSKFTSVASSSVLFSPSIVDQAVEGLNATSQNVSTVLLVWKPIQGVDGYRASYFYPENNFMGTKFMKNVSTPQILIHNLAPGMKYLFKVRAYKGSAVGPPSTREFQMAGTKLPHILDLKSTILNSTGTSVKITWNETSYKQKHVWQYQILWGKTIYDLKRRINVVTTTNTTAIISHLHACETYIMAVLISGPIGSGPTTEFQVMTKEDTLAPPKTVAVHANGKSLNITWLPPCPKAMDNTLRYLVSITETTLNRTSYFDIPTTSGHLTQSHWVESHYGGEYRIIVSTYLKGARPSSPVFASGLKIPPPFELTYNPSDNSFFWRLQKTMPSQLISDNHSYVLYLVRADKNGTTKPDFEVDVHEPPYQATQMKAGQVYYASVAFKDKEGYFSKKSQAIRVEKPIGDGIVVAHSSVVGVAVSVTLMVVVLVIVVGVMALRHKRLARSFAAFANSHYDRSQGTTIITTENSLDEDDSPMIRGFSDDEPLVIA